MNNEGKAKEKGEVYEHDEGIWIPINRRYLILFGLVDRYVSVFG